MWPFGRSWRRAGRHALGAAVTELPSGPLSALSVSAAPAGQSVRGAEPDLATSIARLIASGEAWNVPVSELPAVPPPIVRADVVPAQTQPARPAIPPQPLVTAGSLPRVQLGFRDGTSASLDPSSSQSLALEQLAQSLTHRD